MNNFEKQMMQRATEILDAQPELKKQTEIREKNKIQFGKIFDKENDNDDRLSEEDIERRPCTQKEREKLDASIEQLGDLFADADFFWQLDGALNISLYHGDYIGIHKDIDISFDETQINKVEEFLAKKGYGFFFTTWKEQDKQRIFERVGAEQFKKNKSHQMMIISIDEEGKRTFDSAVSHVDTHLIRRDENGSYIGHEFTKLPQNWFEPRTVNFHGREINCSHPALVAYYKLFHMRAYDDNDLKLLAQSGQLTVEDVNLIEKTFNQHAEDLQNTIKGFVDRIFSRIEKGYSGKEIFEILVSDELVKSMRGGDPETQKFLRELADKIAEGGEFSAEKIYEIVFSTTPISKLIPIKDARFAILRENITSKINEKET